MKPKSRLNEEWTTKDIKVMRQCAKAKVSARICANRLGRTRGAVAFKAMTLGIRFRSIEQPKGVQKTIARRARRAERAAA